MTSFEEDIGAFITQIPARKQLIKNEEGTKNGLIMPFIQKLGYDVFNPLEVCPEYTSDFGVKQKEKVDYAIIKDGKPVMFIECKPVNANLDDKKYGSQLFRYFTTCDSHIVGILTNGIEYRFFSDTQTQNKIDNMGADVLRRSSRQRDYRLPSPPMFLTEEARCIFRYPIGYPRPGRMQHPCAGRHPCGPDGLNSGRVALPPGIAGNFPASGRKPHSLYRRPVFTPSPGSSHGW